MANALDIVSSCLNNSRDEILRRLQITYIGVPIRVLGVIPLLYNMLKCTWIYLRLSRSVPWKMRKYFTLIPNPASGTVTVVAKRLKLSNVGLWNTVAPESKHSKGTIFRENVHYRLYYTLWRMTHFGAVVWEWIQIHVFRIRSPPMTSLASHAVVPFAIERNQTSCIRASRTPRTPSGFFSDIFG